MKLLADILFWPGNAVLRKFGVDPNGDAGLLRWMLNSIIYLVICLIILWNVVL
ncbi:MAG: hypothetical protein ACI9PY_000590 [Ascidiaceihabitans sp.]|jgi:hypothetical protein